jgi:hypothetical protein
MSFGQAPPYVLKHKIRIVTAASLFDGHDAAINMIRCIIQATGTEAMALCRNGHPPCHYWIEGGTVVIFHA